MVLIPNWQMRYKYLLHNIMSFESIEIVLCPFDQCFLADVRFQQ